MLTRNQKLAIIGVIIFSIIDLGITAYGVLFMQVFVEANPIFNQFSPGGDPLKFLSVICLSKVVFIILIVALAAWFNTWDKDSLQGGNLCCYTALGGYALFLGMLGYMNYGRVIL